MIDNDDLSEFLGLVYETIQAPSGWSGVLERYCNALKAKAASVNILDPIQGRVSLFVEHGTDQCLMRIEHEMSVELTPIVEERVAERFGHRRPLSTICDEDETED